MASNTCDIQDEAMQSQIKRLAKSPPTAATSVIPSVSKNEQHWLVAGITLQQVLTPALRNYIKPKILAIFQRLQTSHAIMNQTFKHHLKQLPGSTRTLDYKNINGNNKVSDRRNFNYAVTSHEDFAKLFLRSFMVHFTVIDERCDLSALLLLISNVNDVSFDQNLKDAAKEVQDIRNSWAHCDFRSWDESKLKEIFTSVRTLILAMKQTVVMEKTVLDDLRQWEQEGCNYFSPGRVSGEVISTTVEQLRLLAKYVLWSESWTKESINAMEDCLQKLDGSVSTLSDQMRIVAEEQKQVVENISSLKEESQYTRKMSEQTVSTTQKLKETIESVKTAQESVMENLSTKHETLSTSVETMKQMQERMREDVVRVTAQLEAAAVTPEIHSNIYFPQKNEWFTGRRQELDQLFKLFCDAGDQTVALYGLGGNGKTSLAIEYAYQRKTLYPGGILWVSADSEAAFEDSSTGIARDFGVADVDFKTTYHRLLKWLQGIKQRWLLVVDNVDLEDVPQNLTLLLSGSWTGRTCGNFLITTRRSQTEIEELFSKPDMENVEVGCFSEEDGIEFMKRRTKRPYHPAMHDLLEELGSLPLAVEQAAAYLMTREACTIPEYMEAFRDLRIKQIRKKYARAPNIVCSKERLAIHTTYKMNFDYIVHESEDMGIGQTATNIMKIAAYLSPDDIPIEVINPGEPNVENGELVGALRQPTTRAEVLAILTRFSLFTVNQDKTISVHRLVQEVMQYDDSKSDRQFYLQCGMRMLYHAFQNAVCPNDVLGGQVGGGNLTLWSKLARHACVLRKYLLKHLASTDKSEFTQSLEFAYLSYHASIFLSVSQRQAEAFTAQIDKNTTMALLTGLDDQNIEYLHLIKIPIIEQDRKLLQANMSIALQESTEDAADSGSFADIQESLGVMATKEDRFPDAIRHLSCAIVAAKGSGAFKARIFGLRSKCYINVNDFENALLDAEKCIELDSTFWKGHFWRALALANLQEQKGASFSFCAGHVSASVAAYIHPPSNLQYSMKINYPIVVYTLIKNSEHLERAISNLLAWKHTTLMLKQGNYFITLNPAKSLQLVGIEDGVLLNIKQLQYHPERKVTLHFENISFPETCAELLIPTNLEVSFYRCNFSNGERGCEDFPKCKGGKGCRREEMSCAEYAQHNWHECSRKVGICSYGAIWVLKGGRAQIVKCKINGPGGAGVLVDGEHSSALVVDSVITNCQTNGIEVRCGGEVEAMNNIIEQSHLHGVSAGGGNDRNVMHTSCLLKGNVITRNGHEGILAGISWCERISLHVQDNIIHQNGRCGLSLDGGEVIVTLNKIYDNWAWGLMSHGTKSTEVVGNEIFRNKCGALRIGMIPGSKVFIDENTIRDHTGPAIYNQDWFGKFGLFINEEFRELEEGPQPLLHVTDNNICRNNNTGQQHPYDIYQHKMGNHCAQCGRSHPELKRCSKCNQALYCNRNCQEKHWQSHKSTCKRFQSEYSVILDMEKDVEDRFGAKNVGGPSWRSEAVVMRTFDPNLKGIGKTPKPDPKITKRFIVKIQNEEYSNDGPTSFLTLYDQSTHLDITFQNAKMYNILMECGILGKNKMTGKKIYCWANFEQNGRKLRISTDILAPVQTW